MSDKYPADPKPGDTVFTDHEDGTIFKHTFDGSKWVLETLTLTSQVIYTDQVLVRSDQDIPGMQLADPTTLTTQKEVNHWLDEKASASGKGDYATKDELAALQAQVDNLSGLLIQARYQQGSGITTRPGEFVCVASDTQQTRFSQGTELRFYESDLDQKAPALTRVIVGDYINIVESTTGLSCQLHVTHSAGIVIRYDYMFGTLDRISDRVPYEFRISGQG